jgi:hypothetical protein
VIHRRIIVVENMTQEALLEWRPASRRSPLLGTRMGQDREAQIVEARAVESVEASSATMSSRCIPRWFRTESRHSARYSRRSWVGTTNADVGVNAQGQVPWQPTRMSSR